MLAASTITVSATAVTSAGATPVGATVSQNVTAASAVASGNWTDTSDRAGVLASYNAEFGAAVPDMGWTGDRSTCSAGTTSSAYRQSVIGRVNWFRGMAGLPANVVENATLSAQAQQTSLMNAESGKLSHNLSQEPDGGASFVCRSSVAEETASLSNLYLGRTGPDAITGYIEDPGADNYVVGHRNWVLSPTVTEMGTGDVPDAPGRYSANTLKVVQETSVVFASSPAMRHSGGYVAWPPEGYVPSEVVFSRWSFSLRSATFSSANVTAKINGQSTPVTVEYRAASASGAPFPIMVWSIPGLEINPEHDVVVSISISGVLQNGVSKSYSYDTIVIGDTAPADNDAFISTAYHDFLGRYPSGSELAAWRTKLASGTSRLEFVNTLAQSKEWTTVVVQDLYVNTLGREADAAGASYWASRLQTGTSVAAAASQFYGSVEYVNGEGGTWNAWLTDLYKELMRRSPDSGGLGYWVAQAESRGSGDVAYDFYQSGESRRERVKALYQKFLGRGPDAGGLEYWAGVLKSGDDLALAGFLASSDEYFSKAN